MREGVRNLGGAWLERQLESPGWLPFLSGPLENLAFSFWQLVVFLSIEFFHNNTSFPGEIPGDGVERGHTR